MKFKMCGEGWCPLRRSETELRANSYLGRNSKGFEREGKRKAVLKPPQANDSRAADVFAQPSWVTLDSR